MFRTWRTRRRRHSCRRSALADTGRCGYECAGQASRHTRAGRARMRNRSPSGPVPAAAALCPWTDSRPRRGASPVAAGKATDRSPKAEQSSSPAQQARITFPRRSRKPPPSHGCAGASASLPLRPGDPAAIQTTPNVYLRPQLATDPFFLRWLAPRGSYAFRRQAD
jgi:hypothetical protein